MTDLSEIESLQERIARIEQTVKEIQDSIGKGLEQAGVEPPKTEDESEDAES